MSTVRIKMQKSAQYKWSDQNKQHNYRHFLPALTHIINTCLLTGIFPTAFKQARVTPLLKKPTLNTYLIENFRPVSLLPFIAKTLEWVQVSLFLSQNNKLDAKQSGFRSGHSTETLLTLSISGSSCPPSHRWTSLGFHFTGLNHISLVGLSGEGRYPKHINWSLGFPRDRFLDHSSFPHTLHHWVPSYRHMASPTIAMLMTHSSISLFNQMIQR